MKIKVLISSGIITASLLLFPSFTSCQEFTTNTSSLIQEDLTTPELYKNAIYVSGGTLGATFGFINGSVERMIWGNNHRIIQSVFIRASIGKYKTGEVLSGFFHSSKYILTSYLGTMGVLIGREKSYAEFGFGIAYSDGTETVTSGWTGNINNRDYTELTPALNLGYRYQKPGDNFLFRIGIGYPELYYIGLGICF